MKNFKEFQQSINENTNNMKSIAAINKDLQSIKEKGGCIKNISDGYHTFKELYEFRKMYNATLFNEWAKANMYDVHKSCLHHDGKVPFGDSEYFIVSAKLPTGLISNHYKKIDWDLFKVPEEKQAKHKFDGHTGKDVLDRLAALTK